MSNQVQVANQPNAIQTVKSIMNNDVVKNRFNEILGRNAAGFISSVVQVSNSPSLVGADPKTVMNAAVIAATLKLRIDPNLGFAYIVPYVNKGVKQAQFQMGWKGFYQLALRTNKFKKITTNVVYEGEFKIVNRFKEEYEFSEPTSDKVIGFLAYYQMKSGTEKYLYMSVEDMEKHAKKYSQSYRNDKYNTSQWSQNFNEMGKKTVLKLLLAKFAELSTEEEQADNELLMAQKFDQAVVSKDDLLNDNIEEINEVEYVDNAPDEPVANDAAKAAQARMSAMAKASESFAKKTETENENKNKEELF